MSDRLNTTRRAAPLVAALAATGLIASGCGEGSANAEPMTSLLSSGEQGDQIDLPVPFAVGQSATIDGTFGLSLSFEGLGESEAGSFTFDLRLTETVEEVDDEGGAVIHSTVDEMSVVDAPAGIDTSMFDAVVGVTLVDHRNAQGESESSELLDEDALTDERRAAAEQMLTSTETATFAFPGETVGVGATWTDEQTVGSSDFETPVAFEYELVELTDETYTIDVTIDTEIDEEVDGADVSGAFNGGGTLTGERDNPLALGGTLEIAGEFDIEDDGESATMEMDITVELEVVESSGGSPAATATTVAG